MKLRDDARGLHAQGEAHELPHGKRLLGMRRLTPVGIPFLQASHISTDDLWRASQPHSAGAKKKKKKQTSRTRQEKKQGKREAAAREAAAAAAARAAAQAAAQAAQAAALGRYRLVNAWFYPRGDWYTFYWDGSTADKVARRATYPTLEHDNYDPGPLAERIRRDKRERSDRSSDDSSSDRDSCGTGSTSEANDIFDTLEDHLGYGSDSGSGW